MNQTNKLILLLMMTISFLSCKDDAENSTNPDKSLIGHWTGTAIDLFKCDDAEDNGRYGGCQAVGANRPEPCLDIVIKSDSYTMNNRIGGYINSGTIQVNGNTIYFCKSNNCDVESASYTIRSSSSELMDLTFVDDRIGCTIQVKLVRI